MGPKRSFAAAALLLSAGLLAARGAFAGGLICLQSNSCQARVDPSRLEVGLRKGAPPEMMVS